jgi:hypothetical protein
MDWNPMASFPHCAHFRFFVIAMFPWDFRADTSFYAAGTRPAGYRIGTIKSRI